MLTVFGNVMAQEEDAFAANEEPEEAGSFIEPDTHSFVVKVWLEETAVETNSPVWRGHITHVASGQRRYIQSVGSIPHFIWPHLRKWQIKLPLRDRFCLWLTRQK